MGQRMVRLWGKWKIANSKNECPEARRWTKRWRRLPELEALEMRSLLSGVINGLVFQDFNGNGVYDTTATIPNESGSGTIGVAVDRGVGGVTVTAYDSGNVNRGSAVAAANGNFTLNASGTGPYRVEFTNFPAGYLPGAHGPDSGTTVQFVPDGNSTIRLGLNRPKDYSQNNPFLVTSCYVFGDQLSGPFSNNPVIVSFPYSAGAQDSDNDIAHNANPTNHPLMVLANQVGTTWGLGYNRFTRRVYAAAFMKKHAGFGPSGTGAVYQTGTTGSSATLFADLNAIFGAGTAGADPHDRTNYGTDNFNTAWNAVGKTSLGGLDVSEDGRTVYVMNLADRSLYAIPTTGAINSTTVRRATIPLAPGATGVTEGNPLGDLRPFAVRAYGGKVYVGVVNSAESTQNTADLRAYVYEVTDTGGGLTFSAAPVFQMQLNYPRGQVYAAEIGGGPAAWQPWRPTYRTVAANPQIVIYPQPMLTGIAFDVDGNMVLGFRDRVGDQGGRLTPEDPDDPTFIQLGAISGGDTLRAFVNRPGDLTSGWTLESNSRGPHGEGSGPQNTGQGPGNGRFYFQQDYGDGQHDDVSLGGVAQVPGFPDVVTTVFDPVRHGLVVGGGVRWFNNAAGNNDKSYLVYQDSPAFFGKAAGLGDLVALTDLAPIEIGNRVWKNLNGNGIQNAGEPALAGVTVHLYTPEGTLLATAVTDAKGEYYFSSGPGTNAPNAIYNVTGLTPNTGGYTVRLDNPADSAPGGPLTGLLITRPFAGDNAAINSKGTLADGFSRAVVSTGGPGANDHTIDFGFIPPANLNGCVFVDANNNGVRDPGEAPIPGVRIMLTGTDDLGNTVNLPATTTADGTYSFGSLRPSNAAGYTLMIVRPTGFLSGRDGIGTVNGVVNGRVDSPIADKITNILLGAGNLGINYCFAELIPASLSGCVFVDANNNGVRDPGEAPIAGVTIMVTGIDDLGNSVGLTTMTTADGTYSFANLRPSDAAGYTLMIVRPTGFLSGRDGIGTVNGVVNGRVDSPLADKITNIILGPGNLGINYCFAELTPASLSGCVFVDANNNGVRDSSEAPIGGVTIMLTGTNDLGNAIGLTTTTGPDGNYRFANLRPSNAAGYTIMVLRPGGFLTGRGGIGTVDGVVDGTLASPFADKITNIVLGVGKIGINYCFAELLPSSLAGCVFVDRNNNGVKDPGEPPVAGVTVMLTGTDDQGNAVSLATVTAAEGTFRFSNLRPSSATGYTLMTVQPSGFLPGTNSVGTVNGVVEGQLTPSAAGKITKIVLPQGSSGINYCFAELPQGLVLPNMISKTEVFASSNLLAQVTFVNSLYQSILGRFPDQDGVNHWVQLGLAGVPRVVIATGIWRSPEHRGLQVDQFYQAYLHRSADAGGRAFWVGAMLAGASETDVVRQFLISSEYQATHSRDAAFVTGLYADVLGRPAGDAEVAGWLQALQGGASRDAVVRGFLTSREENLRVVDGYYAGYLRRAPDAAGEQAHLAALQGGRVSWETLAETFLASDEYFHRT